MGRNERVMVDGIHCLGDEILTTILERLEDVEDRKAWCMVCKRLMRVEAKNRKALRLLRSEDALLGRILIRYNDIQHLDLSLCTYITDETLRHVGHTLSHHLMSINLSSLWTFTHLGIMELANRCRRLVDVDLSNCSEVTDECAQALALAKGLRGLRLVKCKRVTDAGIGFIAEGCRMLQDLSLKWCVGVTDVAVQCVASKCVELRSLDLSYLQVTNRCLASFSHLNHLQNLALVGCIGINDNGLACLNKSIQTLDVSKCRNITSSGIISLAGASRNLHRLTLGHCIPVTVELLSCFQGIDSLQTIKFDGCKITSTALESINKFYSSLKEISLSKCAGVTDRGLSAFVSCYTNLKKLDLTCCREITDIAIDAVAKSCKNLTSLNLESCVLLTEKGMSMLGEGCPFLQELDLSDCKLSNAGLKSISSCTELITLKLGFCTNISDEGIAHIGAFCKKIQSLDLYRSTGVGDAGIAEISRGCSMLKHINLSYCNQITDNALRSLSQLRKLRSLQIRGCCEISSEGISAIATGCKNIAVLDIKKCANIDDLGIVALCECSHSLRQINVSHCDISDIGLASLARLSCLHVLKLIDLRNASVNALASLLLTCESLKKVRLDERLIFLLPRGLVEHLKSRGCHVRWMEKYLDAHQSYD